MSTRTTRPLSDLNQLPPEELFSDIINTKALDALIDLAGDEDLAAHGDITTPLLIPETAVGSARFVARAHGVLSGGVLIERISKRFDASLSIVVDVADGAVVNPGQTLATISGNLRTLLAAERTLLNFVSHLSGIATLTSKYVDAVTGEKAEICDTRKTVPGLRRLAKYAVRCGGGFCHRLGLHDAVLIKDNHLAGVSRSELPNVLTHAIERARNAALRPEFVEVEVDDLEAFSAVLGCGMDIVLLDNMTPDQLRLAVELRDRDQPDVQLEASGGVTLKNVKDVAQTGVDRIAVGAITHSAPALDIGLDIEPI